MKRTEHLSKIMSSGFVSIGPHDSISKARQLMHDCRLHHLPVVAGHDLVGIVSSSDVLRVSFGEAFGTDERAVDATLDHMMTVEKIMSHSPSTLKKDALIRDAAELLAKGDFHSVPIVDTDGKQLVGMVTSTDLIRYLLKQL